VICPWCGSDDIALNGDEIIRNPIAEDGEERRPLICLNCGFRQPNE
jgi:hypothetical protein